MAVGIFALGQTDVLADTLTLTVEKNTIGQGMILEPTQVEFSKGETCADDFAAWIKRKWDHTPL